MPPRDFARWLAEDDHLASALLLVVRTVPAVADRPEHRKLVGGLAALSRSGSAGEV